MCRITLQYLHKVTEPMWPVSMYKEGLSSWHGRTHYCNYPPSPSSFPRFLLSPLTAEEKFMALWKAGFWEWTSLFLPCCTSVWLKTEEITLVWLLLREVSRTRRRPQGQHKPAFSSMSATVQLPIHTCGALHEQLSLSTLITWCVLTVGARITFFSAVFCCNFPAGDILMLSVSFVTCWQYAEHRGGILNDSLKWEIILALSASHKCLVQK